MIVSTLVRVKGGYRNKNEGIRDFPTENNVLPQKGGNHKKVLSGVPINTERGDLLSIHLEPAMIVSTVVRVVGGYGNKNEGGRDSPTEDNVLQFRKHAILVHNRCHHGIDMQSLQKHEHKTCQEEEMCQNRDNAANLHIAAAARCALKSRQLWSFYTFIKLLDILISSRLSNGTGFFFSGHKGI